MVKKTSKMVIALILSASMVLGNAAGAVAAEPNTQIGIDAVELGAETEDEISINIEDDDEEDSIAEDFSDEIEIEDATAEESLEMDIMDENAEDPDEEPEVKVTAEGGDTEVVDSGDCGAEGDNLKWTLSKDDKSNYYLAITGSGDMADYMYSSAHAAPWRKNSGSIVSVTLPDGLTSIGSYAFYNCDKLASINIPATLTRIGERAFYNCEALEEASLSEGLTSIGKEAFYNCFFDSLTIPKTVTSIGRTALPACKTISVAEGNTVYDSRNNCNGVIETSSNNLIRGSDNLIIPEGIVRISEGALNYLDGLRDIFIPKTVTAIGYSKGLERNEFYPIDNLESITVEEGNPYFDSRGDCKALIRTEDNCLIAGGGKSTIPQGIVSIGAYAFRNRNSLMTVNIPNTVTEIGLGAFQNCICIEKVHIPDSVTSLGKYAFEYCNTLSEVTGMKGLKVIPEYAFGFCNIKSIDLPEGVTTIESLAFWEPLGGYMLAVKLPKSLTDINAKAFHGTVYQVFYSGDEAEWSTVNNNDDSIKKSSMHYNAPVIPDVLPIDRFELDLDSYEIEVGKSAVLSPRIWPLYMTKAEIKWSSSNSQVATVDDNGNVQAVAIGETTITASAQNGEFIDTCAIKVVASFNNDELLLPQNDQHYTAAYWVSPPYSDEYTMWRNKPDKYIQKTENGYVIVSGSREENYSWSDCSNIGMVLFYLDNDLNVLYKRTVPLELSGWGGFKDTGDAYYIVFGQKNDDEMADVECYRVVKYDHDWNRMGSAGLYDCNTTSPFAGSKCRMDKYNDLLVVRTSHIIYTYSDGKRHQTNISYIVDTSDMTIKFSEANVGNRKLGYVSHSFNQYVDIDEDGTGIYADHGDGSPRALVLFKSNSIQDIVENKPSELSSINAIGMKGEIGENYTGSALGGIAIGDNKYLMVGNSVVQDNNWGTNKIRNIFVSSIEKDLSDAKITWLTNYEEEKFVLDTEWYRTYGASDPYIVKVNGNRFIVLWDWDNKLCYTDIDENGNHGTIYEKDGVLSDCTPLLDGKRILWYTTDEKGYLTFYSLSTENLNNLEIKKTVPPELIEIRIEGSADRNLEAGATDELSVVINESGAEVKSKRWTSSNTSILTVEGNGDKAKVHAIKPGTATITADFDGKTAAVSYTVTEKIIPITQMSWGKEVISNLKNSKLELDEKKSFKLSVVTNPGANEKIIYVSDNSGIVTVDEKGLLKALKEGETKITASPASGKVSISLNIKVNGVLTDLDNENIILEEPDIKPGDVDDNNNNLWIAGVKKNYAYTGTAIKPTVRVYSGTTLLREKTEYTISYKKNTNAGNQATIIVKGKGSYSGQDSKTTFTIDPINISKDDNISAYIDAKGKVFVYWNGTLLKAKKDYTVSGKTITGIGNFNGTVNLSEKATTLVSLKKAVVTVPKSVVYSARPVVLGHSNTASDLVVRAAKNSEPLKYGVDYTVRYETNVNKGKAYVTIIGQQKAGYTGQKKVSFNISPFDIATTTKSETAPHITVSMASSYAYEKGGAMPQPTVRFINGSNKWTLREGVDYTISYKKNKKIGTEAYAVITGKGNFTGKLSQKFAVEGKDISELYAFAADKTFSSKKKGSYYYSVPAIYDANGKTLGNNKDFKVINYLANGKSIGKKDSVANGTVITAVVEGNGFYSGKCEVSYKVTNAAKDISKAKVAISKQTYTGNPLTPELKVTYGKTDTLKKDVDYRIVGYYNNTKKGTARVVIEGIGSYSGSKVQSFTIGSRSIFF